MTNNITNGTKALITIPDELNRAIEIYQAKKRINIKRDAIVQMLIDFAKTKEGKEYSH